MYNQCILQQFYINVICLNNNINNNIMIMYTQYYYVLY